MGRGRAKAKQQKVARELKYYSPNTDFSQLERELHQRGASSYSPGGGSSDDFEDDDEDDDSPHSTHESSDDWDEDDEGDGVADNGAPVDDYRRWADGGR